MKSSSSSGNVLFLILIAVALFAALSYAVTKSTSGGGSGVSKEKEKLIAQEMIDFATSVRVAAQRMVIIQGIDFNTLNFAKSGTGNLAIFAPEGGGMTWRDPPAAGYRGTGGSYNWNYAAASLNWGAWGVGTDTTITGADPHFWVYNVSDGVCKAINELMGHAYEIPVDGNGGGPLSAGNTMQGYDGARAWCYKEGSQPPEFMFILDEN